MALLYRKPSIIILFKRQLNKTTKHFLSKPFYITLYLPLQSLLLGLMKENGVSQRLCEGNAKENTDEGGKWPHLHLLGSWPLLKILLEAFRLLLHIGDFQWAVEVLLR